LVNDIDLVPCVPPANPDPRLGRLEEGYARPGRVVHFAGDTVAVDAQFDNDPPALLTEAAAVMSSPAMTWRWLRNRLTQSLPRTQVIRRALQAEGRIAAATSSAKSAHHSGRGKRSAPTHKLPFAS
jgi:hypothetical protein